MDGRFGGEEEHWVRVQQQDKSGSHFFGYLPTAAYTAFTICSVTQCLTVED